MFTYFHCYMPETWDAQVRAGFITENSGIRFVQNITAPHEAKFNIRARMDGELFNLIKDTEMPFYIDRLQGGTYYECYDYNMCLVSKYREILGDKFYGFQMHEWMSNFLSDTDKLRKGGCPEPLTKHNITETLFREYPFPFLFLESVCADEMEKIGYVTDAETYLKTMHALFEKRQRYTDGLILPCNSHLLGTKIELTHGAKRFFIEVGAGTPNTRIQTALMRGVCKACGTEFGAYYEPWGGEPFSATCCHKEGKNEWFIGNDDFPFKSAGENGGSSRSLQSRIHIYEYLSGASFMSEEWGMANTFYDWNDFEVTPYGKIKLDFLRFTEKYPDVGEFLSPIAVVLPEKLEALHVSDLTNTFAGFPVYGSELENLRKIKKAIHEIFCSSHKMNCFSREGLGLLNYKIPDVIDIVYEDAPGNYDYYIDLTCSDRFAAAHKNIIGIADIPEIIDKTLPVKVDGELHWFVNRSDDTYYLTVLNNSGVFRSVSDGEALLASETKRISVEVKDGGNIEMLEGNSDISLTDGKYFITVPAGGWFFGKVTVSK